jgi:hypothetical protein
MTSTLSPILGDSDKARQMFHAWGSLDTRSMSDQCALALGCDQAIIDRIFADMEGFLEKADQMSSERDGDGYKTIRKLSSWIDNILNHVRAGSDHPGATMAT